MMNEERRRSSCTIYTLSTPLANIAFIKTRQLKQEQRRRKKEGKSSYHSSDSTPLPQHESKWRKKNLEKEQRKARILH